MTDRPTLSALLVALRERAGLSQTAAAVHAGCAPQTWRAVERGERAPDTDELSKLLGACGATEEERGAIAAAALGEVTRG